ncbi:MAG: hypothetical protein ACI398_04175 [Clostridium sp.]
MESRKITVVDSATQSVKVIMSEAETLRELKSDLMENGFNISGQAFYEGLSKVQLIDDESVLPHDVPWRGTTTNELVIRLTKEQKKIESGMTRNEVYSKIKELNLQEVVKNTMGKNFTQCSTQQLIEIIENSQKECTVCEQISQNEGTVEPVNNSDSIVIAIDKILDLMKSVTCFSAYKIDEIRCILHNTEIKENKEIPYTPDEIEEMFFNL